MIFYKTSMRFQTLQIGVYVLTVHSVEPWPAYLRASFSLNVMVSVSGMTMALNTGITLDVCLPIIFVASCSSEGCSNTRCTLVEWRLFKEQSNFCIQNVDVHNSNMVNGCFSSMFSVYSTHLGAPVMSVCLNVSTSSRAPHSICFVFGTDNTSPFIVMISYKYVTVMNPWFVHY